MAPGWRAEGGGKFIDVGTAEELGFQPFFFVCRPWLVGVGLAVFLCRGIWA
jgi:hypothetical protein